MRRDWRACFRKGSLFVPEEPPLMTGERRRLSSVLARVSIARASSRFIAWGLCEALII